MVYITMSRSEKETDVEAAMKEGKEKDDSGDTAGKAVVCLEISVIFYELFSGKLPLFHFLIHI